jgi:histidine triad (HIT) family protein
MPTLFEKICQGEIPADIVYQDDLCVCFRDIAPQAPVHLLLVPRKAIVRIAEASAEDQNLLGHMMTCIKTITEQQGLAANGFRLVINNGPDGGEAVPHLHIHILGGRQMQWPPG